MKVYIQGKLAGSWVRDGADYDFVPLVAGSETGSGYVAAAIGHEETKKANKETRDATIRGQEQARAELEKQYAISQGWLEGQDERNLADVNAQNAFLTDTYTGQNLVNMDLITNQNALNTRIGEEQAAENRADLQPWMQSGAQANKEMADLQGLNGPEAQAAAQARFQMDPGFRFRIQQGQQAIERSAAGRGGLFSGKTGVELQQYGQNFASNEFQNAFARLMGLATTGLSATSTLSGLNTSNRQAYAGLNNANTNALMGVNNQNVNNMSTLRNNNTIGQVDRSNQNNAFRIGMGNEYATNMANIDTGIAGAQANYFQQQNQNTVNTLNNAANYTDTMSVNTYNRAADVAGTVYGGGGSKTGGKA